MQNFGPDAPTTTAIVSRGRGHANLVVVDGALTFGPVAAGDVVMSLDTFTIRDRRRQPHNPVVLLNPAGLRFHFSIGNAPPVADAGPDQTIDVGQTVQLDGSGSHDPDGDPLTFDWSFVSVPSGSGAVLDDPHAVDPAFIADAPGVYVVQLVVHDGSRSSAPDTAIISTTNTAPVADAGPDQTVAVGATVQLDGSGSTDVDGDPLTFSWSLVARPSGSAAVLTDPSSVTPTFVADLPGTYVVQLIVSDGVLASVPDTVTVTTGNTPPVANAGPDQTVPVGAMVVLDGSASTDVDGDLLSFSWAFVAKPAGSTAALSDPSAVGPMFVADVPGTYVVQLIVNDGLINSAPDTVTITTENLPPVANEGPDQTAPVGSVVVLDGSGSSDADGDPLSFQWSFTSRPAGSTATLSDATAVVPSFVVDAPGTYVVQLIVNDGQFDSAPDSVTITTRNSRPIANAGTDQTVLLGATVQLDGSGSTDPDLDPLTYNWSLIVKPSSSTAVLSNPSAVNPTFLADAAGTYVAQLIVNDGEFDSLPDTVVITVQAPTPGGGIGCGELVSGTIAEAAQVDQLTFTGQANDRVTLTLTRTGFSLTTATATVFSPTEAGVVTFNANSQQQLTLPETGTYVIQVRAANFVGTGSYTLGRECLLPTSPVDATLACGGLVARSLESPAQVDQLTFTGQANDRVTLTLTRTGFSLTTATATVFSPTGAGVVTFNANSQQQLTLPETGTYVIQVRAANFVGTGSYTLGRECLLATSFARTGLAQLSVRHDFLSGATIRRSQVKSHDLGRLAQLPSPVLKATTREPDGDTRTLVMLGALVDCMTAANSGTEAPVTSTRVASKGAARSAAFRMKTRWPVGE